MASPQAEGFATKFNPVRVTELQATKWHSVTRTAGAGAQARAIKEVLAT